jgi:prolyl-tRNA synthetase
MGTPKARTANEGSPEKRSSSGVVMRVSRLLTKTLRQPPAEADTVSHQLLLRAGMISQVAAGVYSYLPLGWRVLRKIENIIREEMDRAGGQELFLPVLQPVELWEETGRHLGFGPTLFTLKDRRDHQLFLGPTHEEVITQVVRRYTKSYRDLPLLLYQIQTKFRDEPRPRGGLIRVREFHMLDLYSFDADDAGLEQSYQKMIVAYQNIYRRCGLPALMVEADSGAIGGKDSHEFMALAPSGEDEVLHCPGCGYAANAEKASFQKGDPSQEEPLPLEEVATPGIVTIEDLARFLGVPRARTLKAVFCSCDGKIVFAAIRGDLEINEIKLKRALGCPELRLATEQEAKGAGLVAGWASPLGLRGIKTVADDSVALARNLVAGGNRPDTHIRNVNYPRDFTVDIMTDIALARAGLPCPRCGGLLASERGIEVGHVFKLETFISEKMSAQFLDQEGKLHPLIMGCYGMGLGRLMAAVVEVNHDDKGILWPPSIAPYQIYLCPLLLEQTQVRETAERLYRELKAEGLEVLYDDREESPGVKFNDADLLGTPLRLTVSPRTLKQSSVELKLRQEKEAELLPLEGLAPHLRHHPALAPEQ